MKARFALVVGLIMLLVGTVGLAQGETSSFTVPADSSLEVTGGLTFSGTQAENVTDPWYSGTATTDPLTWTVKANHSVKVTFTWTNFAYQHPEGWIPPDYEVYLPTRLWDGDGNKWWGAPEVLKDPGTQNTFFVNLSGIKTNITKLEVTRSGIDNPAGIYETTVTITVSDY